VILGPLLTLNARYDRAFPLSEIVHQRVPPELRALLQGIWLKGNDKPEFTGSHIVVNRAG
jgi:hypothetical protein